MSNKRSTCTKCRMRRIIVMSQDYEFKVSSGLSDVPAEKYSVRLCMSCLVRAYMSLTDLVDTDSMRRVCNKLIGGGNNE